MTPQPLINAEQIVNIINDIVGIQRKLKDLNKHMEGINSQTFTQLRAYKPWNDTIDFNENFIEFKEK